MGVGPFPPRLTESPSGSRKYCRSGLFPLHGPVLSSDLPAGPSRGPAPCGGLGRGGRANPESPTGHVTVTLVSRGLEGRREGGRELVAGTVSGCVCVCDVWVGVGCVCPGKRGCGVWLESV